MRKPAPDPAPDQKPKSAWKAILGVAVGLGAALLAVLSSVSLPDLDSLEPSPEPDDSGYFFSSFSPKRESRDIVSVIACSRQLLDSRSHIPSE